jgi:CDP-6-deoxy-D-xylo-4-hexulose-3-dehydrase
MNINKIKNFKPHPLMDNNISKNDVDIIIRFLKKNKKRIFTQSKKVREFESKWSTWLGVKYSVFVNSGASANLITMLALKILKGKGEVIVPTLTWISDIASVLQNGFKPVFVDINPKNLCMDEAEIIKNVNSKTKGVFLSHIQGFNGLSENLLKYLKKKKIELIEDVCESHGAKFKNKKLGTYGLMSNFSFYYAHHLSTIEGGMVCTNNKKIYELLKVLRSHGMARELGNPQEEKKIIKKYPKLSPKFIFLYPCYNVRNNEISAVIGINQLKRLDKNNKIRNENLKYFLKNIDSSHYQTNFDLKGCSNYAFPLVMKKKNFNNRAKLENKLKKFKIEFRRGNAGGGNQLRQPYLKNFVNKSIIKTFKNVDHVHFFGYYIGNYPTLKKEKIYKICKILNSINYE